MQIIKWLILISFLDSSYAFATSEAFAAVLDIFHSKFFHRILFVSNTPKFAVKHSNLKNLKFPDVVNPKSR